MGGRDILVVDESAGAYGDFLRFVRVSPASMPYSAPHRLQRGEIVGHPLSIFDAPDNAAPARVRNELEVAGAKGRCEDERWQTRQGGCRFWASGVIAALHNER
jgi:hypothetical protein